MRENKLIIFINKPVKEVFDYSLESTNVPKWIIQIKEEIPEERPVKLGTQLRNIGVNSKDGMRRAETRSALRKGGKE